MKKGDILSALFDLLRVSGDDVFGVYIHGSRLYGVHNETSDYDVVVVLNDHVGPLTPINFFLNQNRQRNLRDHRNVPVNYDDQYVPYGDTFGCRMSLDYLPPIWRGPFAVNVVSKVFDVSVYHFSFWEYLIDMNTVRVMMCLFAPEEYVIFERSRPDFTISLMKLKRELYTYTKKREKRAVTEFNGGKIVLSKKNLMHILRISMFSIQLLEYGKIINFEESNHLFFEVMSIDFDNWESLEKWYLSHKKTTYEVVMTRASAWQDVRDIQGGLNIIGYINSRNEDLHIISQELALSITPYRDNDILFHFEHDSHIPSISPVRSAAVCECTGLILDSQQSWNAVCCPKSIIFTYSDDKHSDLDEKYVPKIHFESSKIYIRYNGCYGSLFYYQGEWLLSSYCGVSIYAKTYCERNKIQEYELYHFLREHFWSIFNIRQYSLPTNNSCTYDFVFHPELNYIYCCGARDTSTLEDIEMNYLSSEHPSWEFVEDITDEIDKQKDIEVSVTAYLEKNLLSPVEFIGVHIRDAENSVIFHTEQYNILCSLTKFMDDENVDFKSINMTDSFLTLALSVPRTQRDQFQLFYPDWASWFRFYSHILESIETDVDEIFSAVVSECSSKADFSKQVKGFSAEYKSILFSLFNLNYTDCAEYFRSPDMIFHRKLQTALRSLARSKLSQLEEQNFSNKD